MGDQSFERTFVGPDYEDVPEPEHVPAEIPTAMEALVKTIDRLAPLIDRIEARLEEGGVLHPPIPRAAPLEQAPAGYEAPRAQQISTETARVWMQCDRLDALTSRLEV